MAAIITLPQAPNTSLANLGAALYGAASDYAEKKRADEIEARRRAERLADITSERQWAQQQTQDERQWRVSQYEQAIKDKLVEAGDLSVADRGLPLNSPQVQAAYQKANTRGMVANYPLVKEALASGLLLIEDLSDPMKLADGLRRFQEEKQLELGRVTEAKFLGQKSANEMAAQSAQTKAQIAATLKRLQDLEVDAETPPDQNTIMKRAFELAMPMAKTKGMPTQDEIASQIETAAREAAQMKQIQLSRQIQILGNELTALRYQQAQEISALSRFGGQGFYGDTSAAAVPSPAPAGAGNAAPPKPVSIEEATKAAVAALKAKKTAQTVPTGPARFIEPAIKAKHEAYTNQRLQDIEATTPGLYTTLGTALEGMTQPFHQAARVSEGAGRALAGRGFTLPEESVLQRFGESQGQRFSNLVESGVDEQWEDWVLQNRPNSPDAAAIRQKRSAQGIFPSASLNFAGP